jgi:hypothetical protein
VPDLSRAILNITEGVKDFRFKRNGFGIQLLPMIMTIPILIPYV